MYLNSRMYRIFLIGILSLMSWYMYLPSYADTVTEAQTSGVLGSSEGKVRTGDFSYTDIPQIIVSATEWFLALSGTVSIMVLIYGALRMQIGSGMFGKEDSAKGKGIMTAGITGFILSASAWVIVRTIVTLLTETSTG